MGRFSLLFFALSIIFISPFTSVNAQRANVKCGIDAAWQQAIERDPSLVQQRANMELQIERYIQARKLARTMDEDLDSVLIIPTVFHIMHEGNIAGEDIPDDNVRSCIQITNQDFRRQNADTTGSPTADYFKSLGADCKIEFRLATIDPNGKPTNGITRYFTHRTNSFGTYDQALVDWPPDKYMNVWVVESINGGPPGGETIGYALLPPGFSAIDGVVLHYKFVGDIGVASNASTGQNYSGRDGDHEIGHYMNLFHIWGDADCGDDKCADTPTQKTNSFGCPALGDATFSCNNDTAMTNNYMDYSDGACKNIFTHDQKGRMRATLYTFRRSLWDSTNLKATGTDQATYNLYDANVINPPIAPKADFLMHGPGVAFDIHASVCSGQIVTFSAPLAVTNGTPTSWDWSFPGGTPVGTTHNNQAPTVAYSTPGTYAVTLRVANVHGADSITINDAVYVDFGHGVYPAPKKDGSILEGFENGGTIPWGWTAYNDDKGVGSGPGWQITNRASYSGNNSISVQNYKVTAPGAVKELVTVPFDLRPMISGGVLNFRLAYGKYWQSNLDSLSVMASSDCGQHWTELGHFGSFGNALAASGGYQPNDFVPTHDQWQAVNLPIGVAFNRKPNVKFRFFFLTNFFSNNIYIDDINVTATVVGINEVEENHFTFSADPNPASAFFTLNYELKHAADVTIGLYDLQGRMIRQLENTHAGTGSYQTRIDAKSFNLASGVYIVKMTTLDGVISKKLVYSN